MTILVIGAHHGVGALVVAEARARGRSVQAFDGDVLEADAVVAAVRGVTSVVSTLGPGPGAPTDLCARGTAHIVTAMQGAGVRRVVAVSGALIGYPQVRLGWVYRQIEARVPAAMLADRRAAEQILRESGLAWTLMRPTRLTNIRPRGRWRADPSARVGALSHIARGDLAAAILEALETPAQIGQALVLQY